MERVKFERRKGGEVAVLRRAAYERLVELAHKTSRQTVPMRATVKIVNSKLSDWLHREPVAQDEAAEDAGTRRIMARARKEVRNGELLIPAEFSDRMQRGESPIRVMREMRGLAQTRLAAKAKISQPVLSQFERSQRTPSLATLKRLAVALAVPIATLTGETQRAWVASKVSTIKRGTSANRPRSGRRQAPAP
jgi:ribosome-binding protein aMBF1 (putative translation factor)